MLQGMTGDAVIVVEETEERRDFLEAWEHGHLVGGGVDVYDEWCFIGVLEEGFEWKSS